jgi:hypothetical protein
MRIGRIAPLRRLTRRPRGVSSTLTSASSSRSISAATSARSPPISSTVPPAIAGAIM